MRPNTQHLKPNTYFLQYRNLPGMIKLVLRDPLQHVAEVISLSGNTVVEARVGQGRNGFDESIVRASRL